MLASHTSAAVPKAELQGLQSVLDSGSAAAGWVESGL
jgi:hypothetical protein